MLRAKSRCLEVRFPATRTPRGERRSTRARLSLEVMEGRALLSLAPMATGVASPMYTVAAGPTGSPTGLNPNAIAQAYGANSTEFGTLKGDGFGQVIAIVDAYNEPTLLGDVTAFDSAFSLPALNLIRINQSGGTTLPSVDAPMGAGIETALDVEAAHSIAPRATIVLVEANSLNDSDLYPAINTARSYPGVSVVSMSFGQLDFSGESAYDSYFTTPSGHTGVTFVAATGDYGDFVKVNNNPPQYAFGTSYPASSPNVVAVGGTTLQTDAYGNYSSEVGWSSNGVEGKGGSGGGISVNEPEPSYQKGVISASGRAVPDVSMVADPNTGFPVYDLYDNSNGTYSTAHPWQEIGGTSLAAPLFAGVVSIIDQGRVSYGRPTLDGPSQTLPSLYGVAGSDYHDVTSGNNGYSAGTGYDLVTGRGSPVVPSLARDLAGTNLNATTFTGTITAGQSIYSPNGKYRLTMQGDGNLVEYGPSSVALWASFTSGSGNYAWMQSDGNLVVYSSSNQALWSSGTSGNTGAYLSLLNNGTTTINQAGTNNFLWTGNTSALVGRVIAPGEDIFSTNGQYRVEMQVDGNFVEYSYNDQVIWDSRTSGNAGAYAVMQGDGNLVVYSSNGAALWTSGTGGKGNSELFLQTNGNLGVYQVSSDTLTWTTYALLSNQILLPNEEISSSDGQYTLLMQADGNLVETSSTGAVVFSTGTSGNPGAYLYMQPDGNLVVYASNGTALWSSGTSGHPGAFLVLLTNGELGIAYNGTFIWSS